jgi:signal peptidase II
MTQALAMEPDAGRTKRFVLAFAAAILVLILDQVSKIWILDLFAAPGGRAVPVTGFFNLVLVWNRGMSFGLFNDGATANAVIFSLLAAAIVGGLLIWLWRAPSALVGGAIGLVIGGAIGNVVDRLRLGAVVDFLDIHAGLWHWPAFNVADSAICVGVGLMLIDGLLGRRDGYK